MAYTLVSALGKSLTGGQEWSSIDLGNMTFAQVIDNYSKVYAILTNPFITGQVSLDLSTILPNIFNSQSLTFNAYLASLGNTALPTSSSLPSVQPSYCRYMNAFQAGYSVTPIASIAALDSKLPIADKPHVVLQRANTDYESFYQNCLVSINGFIHMTDTDKETGVWVVNGMKSCIHSKKNKIGILDFQDIGTLTIIPITADMIYKQNTKQSLSNHAYINVGQDLTNTTVMVVIGGYLHLLDTKTFKLVGTQSLMIDFNNYPLLERYYESKDYIDLSNLNLSVMSTNTDAISVEEITSDAAITALLTLSQSFIVLLNNTDVSVDFVQLEQMRWPGCYASYVTPVYPLITGYGKLNEYWWVYEKPRYALKCADNLKDNYIFNTVPNPRTQPTVTNQADPMNPRNISAGYYMQIRSDIVFS
jgi:hypothetical protein